MADTRIKDLPEVTSATTGDVFAIDGISTRRVTIDNLMKQVLLSGQTQQIKTTAGNVTVAVSDGLIAVNKSVGAATGVTLPDSSTKVGPVKVGDFKGDAGTNNITVTISGAGKFNGNQSSFTIAGNGASYVFTPLADGSGYVV
jgi:hypothetical protein